MVRDFTSVAGWMRFDGLDRLYQPTHVIAWRFRNNNTDPWTLRVNAFKERNAGAVAGATRVLERALPPLMAHNGWNPAETAITAALSSRDTACVPTKPLPTLGALVAARLNMRWLPDILTKDAHQPMHNVFSSDGRDAIAATANYRCGRVQNIRRILVLDDVVTMGNTFKNITAAIRETNRNVQVHLIGLGKSESLDYARSIGKELTNEHVPAAWATLWDAG